MRLGLVTYQWGAEWDLPTLLKNCEKAGYRGVELRTTHKHGVEPSLGEAERAEVAKRFADSPVQLVGLGTACEFHSPDPATLKKNIDEAKSFVELCHDLGGGGVKVRPNRLLKDVPPETTLRQIGAAMKELAEYGDGYGVEIRLEVHGAGTNVISNFKQIMDAADHSNAKVCWNCNREDTAPPGLKENFESLAARIGTVHIHDLRKDSYPWPELFELLKKANFEGWTLVEGEKITEDPLAAMIACKKLWDKWAQGESGS